LVRNTEIVLLTAEYTSQHVYDIAPASKLASGANVIEMSSLLML
jgi:hypothetical protein